LHNTYDASRGIPFLFRSSSLTLFYESTFFRERQLIQELVDQVPDKNAIVLDSFAGSGTTAHAVLNLNKQDGGNRKFILVEMEDYAENVTAERVKRVITGYGTGSKKTEGTGGSFGYYELGQPLFIDEDVLNEEVETEKIRQYVWFSETHKSYKAANQSESEEHLLGISGDTAYYFYYYKNRLTTLDDSFLRTFKTKAGQYIIYADICVLDAAIMQKYHITFKKIPRDITRF
jgi:adenine-specific DNA-methyltransferase